MQWKVPSSSTFWRKDGGGSGAMSQSPTCACLILVRVGKKNQSSFEYFPACLDYLCRYFHSIQSRSKGQRQNKSVSGIYSSMMWYIELSCFILLGEMRQKYLNPPSSTQVLGRNKIVRENSPIYSINPTGAKEKLTLFLEIWQG